LTIFSQLGDKRFINAAIGALEGLWKSRSKLGLVKKPFLTLLPNRNVKTATFYLIILDANIIVPFTVI